MAGDDQDDRIGAVGRSDRARVRAEPLRELSVAARLAGRDLAQELPDGLLEGRSHRIDGDLVERVEISREIRLQPIGRWQFLARTVDRSEAQLAERRALGGEIEGSERRFDGIDAHCLLLQDNQMAAAA